MKLTDLFLKKIFATGILALLLLTGSSFFFHPFLIEKMSATLLSKQVQAGKSVTIKGEIYYTRDGNMVTNFTFPKPYIVISNRLGEVRLYDPAQNTVLQYQNYLFSTQSSQFYYFLSGKIADMGLADVGYVQEKTYPDKNLLVSLWRLKTPDKKSLIQRVKLVYQGQKPIYMHYEDAAGKVLRKVFYYNYTQLESNAFPYTTTEIVYEGNDSTVTKTTFSDFKLNQQANSQYFDFKIPSNAKIERQ